MDHTLTSTETRIASGLRSFLQEFRRWYRERRTVSALQALGDADLKDIGICRCEIAYIARIRRATAEGP